MDVNSLISTGAIVGAAGTLVYSMFSSLKSIPKLLWTKIKRRMIFTVRVYNYDELFNMLEDWLSSYHSSNYKDVEACVSDDIDDFKSRSTIIPSKGKANNSSKPNINAVIYKQEDSTFIVKYKGKRILFIKSKEKLDKAQNLKEIWFRHYKVSAWMGKKKINELFNDVIDSSIAKKDVSSVSIYTNDRYGQWFSIGDKRTKSLDSTIIPKKHKEYLIDDINQFLSSEDWYIDVCIPYKRGYCFYGPPGTGKTTLAMAIARYTKRRVFFLNMNSLDNDSQLLSLISGVSNNSILIIEDIDRIFSGRENVNPKSQISFSSLLNCLDGAISKHNIITIITTNYIDKLDSALLRTGRLDVKMEIPIPTDMEITEYIRLFYRDQSILVEGQFELTMSDIQEICLQNKNHPLSAVKQIYLSQNKKQLNYDKENIAIAV